MWKETCVIPRNVLLIFRICLQGLDTSRWTSFGIAGVLINVTTTVLPNISQKLYGLYHLSGRYVHYNGVHIPKKSEKHYVQFHTHRHHTLCRACRSVWILPYTAQKTKVQQRFMYRKTLIVYHLYTHILLSQLLLYFSFTPLWYMFRPRPAIIRQLFILLKPLHCIFHRI
jgi:hypothetical protein